MNKEIKAEALIIQELQMDTRKQIARIVFAVLSIFLILTLLVNRHLLFQAGEERIYFFLCAGVLAMTIMDIEDSVLRIFENNALKAGLEDIEGENS